MAKKIPVAMLDQMLAVAEGSTVHVCSAEPADYSGIAAVELASGAQGTYTKGTGDVSGRKNTVSAVTGLNITTSGVATHVAVSNGTDTLKLVTTCQSQGLSSGGTVDLNSWKHEIADPT